MSFLTRATPGGLLTWPLGAARVAASSWVRAGWRCGGPGGSFEFERDGPPPKHEERAPWAGILNRVEGQ